MSEAQRRTVEELLKLCDEQLRHSIEGTLNWAIAAALRERLVAEQSMKDIWMLCVEKISLAQQQAQEFIDEMDDLAQRISRYSGR